MVLFCRCHVWFRIVEMNAHNLDWAPRTTNFQKGLYCWLGWIMVFTTSFCQQDAKGSSIGLLVANPAIGVHHSHWECTKSVLLSGSSSHDTHLCFANLPIHWSGWILTQAHKKYRKTRMFSLPRSSCFLMELDPSWSISLEHGSHGTSTHHLGRSDCSIPFDSNHQNIIVEVISITINISQWC